MQAAWATDIHLNPRPEGLNMASPASRKSLLSNKGRKQLQVEVSHLIGAWLNPLLF